MKQTKYWIGCLGIGALAILVLGILAAVLGYFYFYGNLPPAATQMTSGPVVTIQDPAAGAQFTKGDSFILFATANDEAGVVRLDLWVDSTLVLSQSSPDASGLSPLSLSYPMVAAENGTYALIARAYNSQGESGESVVHYVTVVETSISAPTQGYAQYTIQAGDTLENIAARLGVSVADILQANPGLSAGQQLQPGQVLKIPMPKGQPAQAAVPGPNGVQPAANQGVQHQNGANPVNPSQQVVVKSANVSPSPVYYGKDCKTEPTVLNAIAQAGPVASISKVMLAYSFTNNAGGKSQDFEIPMALGGNDYKADVNVGGEAEAHLAQDGGKLDLRVEAYDTSGKLSYSQVYSVTVKFCAAQPVQPGPNAGLPGILPQFLPGGGGINQVDPNLFPPSLFPDPNMVLPSNFGNVTAPQDLKIYFVPGECKLRINWKDAQNETGYRIDRYEFGQPNPKTVGNAKADATIFDDTLPQPGKYGYRVSAERNVGGKYSQAPSALVWTELLSSDKCKPLAEFKYINFQPVYFLPTKDPSLTHAFVQVTIGDLPTLRVPASERTSFTVGDLGGQPGETLLYVPAPEQIYSQPGASLYVQVHADGAAPNQPPVDLGGFAASHSANDLTSPNSRNQTWLGEGSGFKMSYRIWLGNYVYGKDFNSSIPVPTNLKLDTSNPAKRVLTWDYDPDKLQTLNGFIVYHNYICPGGSDQIQHPMVVGKSPQRVEIVPKNEPAGCTCGYQVSAFGSGGESGQSQYHAEQCTTTQPVDGVNVTFESLTIGPSLFQNNAAITEIHLFANEFERHTEAALVEQGRDYLLNQFTFNGRADNNTIGVGIGGSKSLSVNVNFSISNICQGSGLVINKQGNTWERSDGKNYIITSTDGKCQVEVSLKNVNLGQGGQPPAGAGIPPIAAVPSGAQPPIQPPAAGGNGTVKFINKTSHPIIALVIDGQDVIETEAQVMSSGASLDVYGLTPGNHAYAPSNGFGSGNNWQTLLPLPVGTFTDSAGTVVINDPTIGQLLTNYGGQGAFVGEYWTGSPAQLHYAGFCFDANGGFNFYIDGKSNDSGTYSLIDRQPGVYSVTFRVANSTGAEQFEGTYYYAGAFAGELDMFNGPADWKLIKYVRDIQCP